MEKKKKKQKNKNIVTFVDDPHGLGAVIETAEIQDISEPLTLDQDLEELTHAMKEEHERLEEELLEQSAAEQAQLKIDQKAELESQIAEDIAIENENKKKNDIQNDPEVKAALPQPDENGDLDIQEVKSCIETLLFISDKPLSKKKLKDLLGENFPAKTFNAALKEMKEDYQKSHHGFEIVEIAGGFQFRTKPGRAALAKQLAKVQAHRLSRGAMETLAVVAYKQPVMKEEIDKVRGVDSSHFIRGLLEKKLIEISGRSELPGRPMLYSTTADFLEIFGLSGLDSLPPLKELERMIPKTMIGKDAEDPKVVKMRKLVEEMNSDDERIEFDPKEDELFLKEIRERVKSISITTPTLQEEEEKKKAPKEEIIKVQPELTDSPSQTVDG